MSRLLSMALALVCLIASGLPAHADNGPWPDRRDGSGPLAIEKIEIGHQLDSTTIEVTFERAVDPGGLGKRDFIVFDFDGNGDRKSEEWVYFFPVRGRWRGASYYPRLDDYELNYYYDLNRTSPRSVKLVLPPYAHQSRGGYLFRVASSSRTGPICAGTCFDFVPNANWLIHDWTYPVIRRFEVPEFSLATGDTAAFETIWQATDEGFSRLSDRTLWKRLPRTKKWERLARDRRQKLTREVFETEQGTKLQLRVTAVDGAGNKVSSEILETVVPFDDANDANEAVYFGLWEQVPADGAYLDSAHVSSTPLDTFSFTGTGRRYCITYRAGGNFDRALLETAEESRVIDMSSPTYLGTECIDHSTSALRTAVLSVYDGSSINIDAYWFE